MKGLSTNLFIAPLFNTKKGLSLYTVMKSVILQQFKGSEMLSPAGIIPTFVFVFV